MPLRKTLGSLIIFFLCFLRLNYFNLKILAFFFFFALNVTNKLTKQFNILIKLTD